MYLKTVSPEEATGEVAELYRHSMKGDVLMEADSCWTVVPGLYPMVDHLLVTARKNFTLGLLNWRLITLVAAKEVPSTYCSHVYGKLLADELGKDKVLAIQQDFRNAGLGDKDVAMLAYAQQIARDASKITENEIEALRSHGFNDVEIGEIAFCASFRCFLSRYFDAVGATCEPMFFDEDPAFRAAMTVGKPIQPASGMQDRPASGASA